MKTLLSLLFSALLPGMATADNEAAQNAALHNLAATKREAVVVMIVGGIKKIASYGAFISKDGLALVDMGCLVLKEKPEIVTSANTPLAFPKILGIFPEHELALVKFDHQPKAFLKLAGKEPEVGGIIALVTINVVSARRVKTPPPMVGPVMAKRSMVTTNLRQSRFTKVLSFGSGLSLIQQDFAGPGRFAINRKGELVAFMGAFESQRGQTLIYLLPVATLAGRVEELKKAGKDLGHPLPPAENPYDLALLDEDFSKLGYALQRGKTEEAKATLGRLRTRYPKSTKILLLEANWTGNLQQDLPEGDPLDSKAHRVQLLSARANLSIKRNDFAGAIAIRKAAIALSPEDYVVDRLLQAGIHGHLRQFAKAEKLFEECYQYAPEIIDLARSLEMTLRTLKKNEDAQKMTDRIIDLKRIYRRR